MTGAAPIACSLDGDAARRRWHEWSRLMGLRLRATTAPERLTVHFPLGTDTSTRLSELVAAERECCGFVEWDLAVLGDETVLTVRGDREGVIAMAESFGISE